MHCGGHADVEIRLVSPMSMGPPVLLPPAGSLLNGGHVASSGCGKNKYKYKYMCVCVYVCMHACVYLCACACMRVYVCVHAYTCMLVCCVYVCQLLFSC